LHGFSSTAQWPSLVCLLQTEADGKAGVGEAAVWQVAAEVAAGLAFLHAAGVLHLDVKPGNVFADGAGNLRLGDFGLAVLRHQWVSVVTF
jgi:serine/threonine protein kinase